MLNAERLVGCYPVLVSRANQFEQLLGFAIDVVQGRRTFALQAALYAQGRQSTKQVNALRAGVGLAPISDAANEERVTDAAPGHGWHEYGLAFDAAPVDPANYIIDWNVSHPAWEKMLAVAPSVGLAEGAAFRTFPDNPHFYPHEIPPTPDDNVRYLYSEGGIQAVWDEIGKLYFGGAP